MKDTPITSSKGQRPAGPALDEQTFERLRRRITRSSGIFVPTDGNSRFILERRLAPRLRYRGVTSFQEYERLLDEQEMDLMLDAVAVHETYFFREERQLRAFRGYVLPEFARLDRPITIWSAGCSTGEEAYTIAMLLAEEGLLAGSRARVLASDLSRRVIDLGRTGFYGPSSFRTMDDRYKERYFSESRRGLWRVCDLIRDSVSFEQFNLMELNRHPELLPAPPGEGFDVIFCRNVLMYFDYESSRETVSSLHSLLAPGGFLLLGHAESLLPYGTGFSPVQIDNELVYRK
ncbi:MAG TPA: protein-glutamate O-methyltransferase CheR [Blastocatellia bacterium]|jgi:chemotaxis protein methyltransferase CheR|nr:protein-glutamate O-methyltransferase CheR [Blastocatellia bacterium]